MSDFKTKSPKSGNSPQVHTPGDDWLPQSLTGDTTGVPREGTYISRGVTYVLLKY